MGLDMYLRKKTYVGANYQHNNVKGIIKLTEGVENKKVAITLNRVSEITENVAYWRKVNAVHNWFVENIQDGNDNCEEYYLSSDKMKELVELCKTSIEIVKKSPKITKIEKDWNGKDYNYEVFNVDEEQIDLKTSSSFFFGEVEYTTYYLDGLEETISQLEPLLLEEGSFYYQSSW